MRAGAGPEALCANIRSRVRRGKRRGGRYGPAVSPHVVSPPETAYFLPEAIP